METVKVFLFPGKRLYLYFLFPALIFIHCWQMRAAVSNVAKFFPTAIISGRSRDKVIGRLLPSVLSVSIIVAVSFLDAFSFSLTC